MMILFDSGDGQDQQVIHVIQIWVKEWCHIYYNLIGLENDDLDFPVQFFCEKFECPIVLFKSISCELKLLDVQTANVLHAYDSKIKF